MHIEKELKYILPGDWARRSLIAHFGGEAKIAVQENYYFYPQNREIGNINEMLRLRREGGSVIATYKRGRSARDGAFVADEFEETLSSAEFAEVISGRRNLSAFDIAPVREAKRDFGSVNFALLGRVENERTKVRMPSGDVLELDRTSFPDGSADYELEVETDDAEVMRGYLLDVFRRLDIDAVAQTKTKFERFMERRKNY